MSDDIESPGISRRDLMKKGAIVGGTLIWAVPVIETLAASPASAASARNVCCFCADPANATCKDAGPNDTGLDHQCVHGSVPFNRADCVTICAAISGPNHLPCNYQTITFTAGPNDFGCTEERGCFVI